MAYLRLPLASAGDGFRQVDAWAPVEGMLSCLASSLAYSALRFSALTSASSAATFGSMLAFRGLDAFVRCFACETTSRSGGAEGAVLLVSGLAPLQQPIDPPS